MLGKMVGVCPCALQRPEGLSLFIYVQLLNQVLAVCLVHSLLAFEISPLCCFTRLILCCFVIGGAVRALNSIFQKWNIKADTKQWNTTGDPCSGRAVDDKDDTGYFYDADDYNPFIKCNCSYDTNSTCHITQL